MTPAQKWYQKMKTTNLKRYRAYLDMCARSENRNRAKRRKDPEVAAAERKEARDYAKARREWRKENDPEGYIILIEKERLAAEEKRKAPGFKEKAKVAARIYIRKRRKSDVLFKILCALRCRMNYALFYAPKADSSMRLLGCSPSDLKKHLEAQFHSGMSWDNYGRGEGKWVIDHIRPCAAFDLTDIHEQIRCFHFKNLQPMWFHENCKKSSKVDGRRVFTGRKK